VGPAGPGFSPYSATSVFAGDPSLIDIDRLVQDKLLEPNEIIASPTSRHADLAENRAARRKLLRRAFHRAEAMRYGKREFDAFLEQSRAWLFNYALYAALKEASNDAPFFDWPDELRLRDRAALAKAGRDHAEDVRYQMFCQFLFDRDLSDLAAYAAGKGVALMGDAPIFVSHDSADVWGNPEVFQMRADGSLANVAGVPPDAFSDEGQLWGNPLYDWDALARNRYGFWIDRLRHAFRHIAALRLDHFIGFERYYAIPEGAKNAKSGTYRAGPGSHFFEAVRRSLGELELVAEDLGVLTDEVKALRDRFDLPGMNILQFSFSPDRGAETSRPHRYRARSVVYTGTHDNDTLAGWLSTPPDNASKDAGARWAEERSTALRYLDLSPQADMTLLVRGFVRAAFANQADTAIIPIQDVLALGREARMNRPGLATGNWSFRLMPGEFNAEHVAWLAEYAETFGRSAE
jgi:4-alpha-glucanotransferase